MVDPRPGANRGALPAPSLGHQARHRCAIKLRTLLLVLLVLLAVSGDSLAHRDVRLTLDDAGVISGLPSEFHPARLQLELHPAGIGISRLALQLGKHHTRFAPCITAQLITHRASDLRLSGSWYHDQTRYPHYLRVHFLDADKGVNAEHQLLFNLHSGQLFELVRIRHDEQGSQLQPLDLDALCGEAVLDPQHADTRP